MLQLLLLTLAGAGMAAMISGADDETSAETDNPNSDEEEDVVTDDIVPEEPEPEEELGDVGATAIFDEQTNVLTIEVGGTSSSSSATTGLLTRASNDVNYDIEIDASQDFAAYSLIAGEDGSYIRISDVEETVFGETIVPLADHEFATVTIVDEDSEATTETHARWTDINGTEGDELFEVQSGGGSGDVFINGGSGNDTIDVGNLAGFVDGGSGDDVFLINDDISHAQFEGGDGADSYVADASVDGTGARVNVDDFEPGTDQIVLELGDRIDENWTISLIYGTSPIGTNIQLSFPDAEDSEGFSFNVSGTNELTIGDIVVVQGT